MNDILPPHHENLINSHILRVQNVLAKFLSTSTYSITSTNESQIVAASLNGQEWYIDYIGMIVLLDWLADM